MKKNILLKNKNTGSAEPKFYNPPSNDSDEDFSDRSLTPEPVTEQKQNKFYDSQGSDSDEDFSDRSLTPEPATEQKQNKFYDSQGSDSDEDSSDHSLTSEPVTEQKQNKFYDSQGSDSDEDFSDHSSPSEPVTDQKEGCFYDHEDSCDDLSSSTNLEQKENISDKVEQKYSFFKIVKTIGVDCGPFMKPRAFFRFDDKTVSPTIFWEQAVHKKEPKGYTTINITYQSFCNKDLISKYLEDNFFENEKNEIIAKTDLTFPEWVEQHFKSPLPPSDWKGTTENWNYVQSIYAKSNLTYLNKEESELYEAKFIQGRIFVRKEHSQKIYDSKYLSSAPKDAWVPVNSAFGPKSRRGNELIYILAVNPKTLKKTLYLAVDWPGVFHHTSFVNFGILAAGTIMIGRQNQPLYDGYAIKVTPESGHFKPLKKRFLEMLLFLQASGAIYPFLQGFYYEKTLSPDLNTVITSKKFFSKPEQVALLLKEAEQQQTQILLSFLDKFPRRKGSKSEDISKSHDIVLSLN